MIFSDVMVRNGWAAMLLAAAGLACSVSAQTTQPPRDAALDRLIDSALRSGPLVAARVTEVAAAGHEVQAARWQYAPTLSTQLQAGTGGAGYYGSVLRADQRLYTGGRLDADLGGALARRESAQLAVQETSLAVALQVVGDWRSLQTALGQQQAALAYRARLDALSGTIGRRIESGVSAPIEQSLLNARLTQSQNELAAARSAASSARAALQRLAGEAALAAGLRPRERRATQASSDPLQRPGASSAEQDAPPTQRLGAAPPAPAPALCAATERGEQTVRDALDRHPAVRRNALDLDAARFALESQRAATRPTVSLRLEQPVGPTAVGVSHDPRLSVVVEYSTDARLAGGSRADASAERLAGLAEQALALRRDVRQQLLTECGELAGATERSAGYADVQAYNDDVLASYTRLFVAGKRGWLDLLNAARESFDTEQAALATQAALQASQYRLALLSGDLALPLAGSTDEPVAAAADPLAAAAAAAAAATPADPTQPAHAIPLPPAPGPASQTTEVARTDPPSPGAAPDIDPAASALLARWAGAWRRKDVAAYLACYTEDFSAAPQGATPSPAPAAHAAWAAQRSARLLARRRIDVQLSDLQFEPTGPDSLAATFTQAYAGDGHRETSRKRLLLRRVAGEWRIAEERELP